MKRSPNAVALVASNEQLTFQELDARSNQIAHHLQPFLAGVETPVGVFMDRSPAMVVALLGILKAGGVYVPLDPGFPIERISLVVNDAQLPVILTSERNLPKIRKEPAQLVSRDGHAKAIAAQRTDQPLCAIDGSHLAYVIYTSGSTGKPKGVMVEHRNVLSFFSAMDVAIGSEPGVWLAVTSISFDISVLELFWTLTRGFKVVLHGDEGPHTVASEIQRHGVTHLQATPSLIRMLSMNPATLKALGGLKQLLLGGEALPASLVQILRTSVKGQIFNMYGPTEATIWSTFHPVIEQQSNIPIGRPLANTSAYVLDDQLHPVTPGEAGELYLGGEGVVRGYWQQYELTHQRFLADPFSLGSRMYRTGDLVRFLPNGALEFLGRVDFQVKIRGHRIELGEIEALLEQHPAVLQCVVVARDDSQGTKQLVAYVVTSNSNAPAAADLRLALAQKLPEFMLPSMFVFLARLPLTANGKIDRNALPAPQPETVRAQEQRPRTELETLIANVWAEVLGLQYVGLDDRFFDIGGHSLLVPEVQIQVQSQLGREISLVDFFQFPTVASLASHLSGHSLTPSTPVSDRAQRRLAARKNQVSV